MTQADAERYGGQIVKRYLSELRIARRLVRP
jgi:hypothetical protein